MIVCVNAQYRRMLDQVLNTFNDYHGFLHPVQSRRMQQVESFDTEKEASEFATDLAMEIMK